MEKYKELFKQMYRLHDPTINYLVKDMIKKDHLYLKQNLLNELDPLVFSAYIGVVDNIQDKFMSYKEEIEQLKN
jgi:hypothetical protein